MVFKIRQNVNNRYDVEEVDKDEMYAFLGVKIQMGLVSMPQ